MNRSANADTESWRLMRCGGPSRRTGDLTRHLAGATMDIPAADEQNPTRQGVVSTEPERK